MSGDACIFVYGCMALIPEIRQETILKTKVFSITEISDIPSLYSSIFALFGRGFRPMGQLARTIGLR